MLQFLVQHVKTLPEQLSLLLVPETYKHKPSLLPLLTSPALEEPTQLPGKGQAAHGEGTER